MVWIFEFILSIFFFSSLPCYSPIQALTGSTMLFHHFPSSSSGAAIYPWDVYIWFYIFQPSH
jgi:hypothetical protein